MLTPFVCPFASDHSASRPGILVLINNGDWELEGEGDYVLQDGDRNCLYQHPAWRLDKHSDQQPPLCILFQLESLVPRTIPICSIAHMVPVSNKTFTLYSTMPLSRNDRGQSESRRECRLQPACHLRWDGRRCGCKTSRWIHRSPRALCCPVHGGVSTRLPAVQRERLTYPPQLWRRVLATDLQSRYTF